MSATDKDTPVVLKEKFPAARESGTSSRTGMSREELTQSFRDNLYYFQGRHLAIATTNDYYLAAAYTVRERLVQRWLRTTEAIFRTDAKVVCYLSAEFLTGPHLGNNLINLGIYDQDADGDQKGRPGSGNAAGT